MHGCLREALLRVRTSTEFIDVLRSVGRGRRAKPLPLTLGADASAVMRGRKRLLEGPSSPSTFHFSCTNCGKCCRLAKSVLVDPFDAFLLYSSPTSTGDVYGDLKQGKLVRKVGLFSQDALMAPLAGLPASRGQAPVLFLNTGSQFMLFLLLTLISA